MAGVDVILGLDRFGAKPRQSSPAQSKVKISSTSSSEEDLSSYKPYAKCSGSSNSSINSNIWNGYHYIPQAEPRNLSHLNDGDVEEDFISDASKSIHASKYDVNNDVILEQSVESYNNEDSRLDSFNDWKYENTVPHKRLAKNGWFKTGRKDDVMCIVCRRVKRKWEEKDSIVGSHKPNCKFREEGLKESFSPCSQSSSSLQHGSVALAMKGVVELGMHTQTEVQCAVAELERKGLFVTTDTIMEELMNSPADSQSYDKCDSSDPVEPSHLHTGAKPKSIYSNTTHNKTKMVKESEHFKSRVTCKVCMDQAVGVLFLPCRHLICCQSCADHLPTCPLCRATIVATIKAFV